MRSRGAVGLALLAAVLLAAGGALLVQSRRTEPCGADVLEPADPRSLQHVLPGAEPPTYARRPPTSGPHQPGQVSGVVAEPIADPLQVGALEAGQVLLQHGALVGSAKGRLDALAGGAVVVAPAAPGVVPDGVAVVATAWEHRLVCRSVDTAALRSFAARHAGKGFAADRPGP